MKKKFSKVLSLAAVALLLTSCGEIVNLPDDKDKPIVDVSGIKGDDININFNDKEIIYDSITTSNSIYAKQINILLNDIAKDELKNEFAVDEKAKYEKAYKKIVDAATGGSYSKDNIFEEYRYSLSLLASMYNINLDGKLVDESVRAKGYKGIYNPDVKYKNNKVDYTSLFDKENKDRIFNYDYTDYINKELIPEIERQYLTAKFIYENNYSSIGNTNARDVVVLKLQDVEDHPGSAASFLAAGYKKLNPEDKTVAPWTLYDLSRIYKGVNLTEEEQKWITDNNLVTKSSKIDEDVKNLKDNINNPNSEYLNLESDFTGSYTYPVAHGEELKRNSLASEDYITSGLFLKSNGIGDLNDTLKNRVFTTDIPEENDTDGNSYFEYINGKYYVKPEKSESGSASTSIINYDSASSSYYVIEVSNFVTSSSIAKRDSDNKEVAAKKQQLALRVAYEMASSDTYKNDAIVHYLKNEKITWSDPDLYKYVEETYPKVFEEEDE